MALTQFRAIGRAVKNFIYKFPSSNCKRQNWNHLITLIFLGFMFSLFLPLRIVRTQFLKLFRVFHFRSDIILRLFNSVDLNIDHLMRHTTLVTFTVKWSQTELNGGQLLLPWQQFVFLLCTHFELHDTQLYSHTFRVKLINGEKCEMARFDSFLSTLNLQCSLSQ